MDLQNISTYPDGYTFSIYQIDPSASWSLKANATWNAFGADVPLGTAQFPTAAVTLTKVAGKFVVV
jgi:hypothetical protein